MGKFQLFRLAVGRVSKDGGATRMSFLQVCRRRHEAYVCHASQKRVLRASFMATALLTLAMLDIGILNRRFNDRSKQIDAEGS